MTVVRKNYIFGICVKGLRLSTIKFNATRMKPTLFSVHPRLSERLCYRIIENWPLLGFCARNGRRARGSVQEFQDQILGFVGCAVSRQFVVDVTCR
jgi:hypothetical protein